MELAKGSKTDLTETAYRIELGSASPGVVDRGTRLAQSVGRTGVCWDNARAESFWATSEVEFYRRFLWPTERHAGVAVGDWIEGVHDRRRCRRHSATGMIGPVEFEEQFTRAAAAADPVSAGRGRPPKSRACGLPGPGGGVRVAWRTAMGVLSCGVSESGTGLAGW